MHRFFIPPRWIRQGRVSLTDEPAHQISHVLRLKPKDHIILLDNSGREYEVEIDQMSPGLIQGRVVDQRPGVTEPRVKVTLYQALLKAEKFEFVLQKGVELGVSAFVPFVSERCVVRKPGENKLARWRKIIQEAAEQSGRALLPALHPVVAFQEACDSTHEASILLWEEERRLSLSRILKGLPFQASPTCNVFIGPEGGFSRAEVAYAESRGIVSVSLGHRILRAETAGLAVVVALLYERGEFG
jgi:16S rRNA (uracil1498-N3)-methyltransferase